MMRGSSSEDDGSDDDDVLASLRGDFADPFQRATARSEADRERDEADEEDERLIGDVAALAAVGDSDDDLDDDALAEEALALAGTRGRTADARWDDDSEDEEEEENEEEEEEDARPGKAKKRTATEMTLHDAAGSGSRALRAYQTSRLATNAAAGKSDGGVPRASRPNRAGPTGPGTGPGPAGYGAGALPAWARPPLQRALGAPDVREDDVFEALAANRALQRRVRAVIREVEADLANNAAARAELLDALRATRGSNATRAGYGSARSDRPTAFDVNGGDHACFTECLNAMRPGRSYFRVSGEKNAERRGASDRDRDRPGASFGGETECATDDDAANRVGPRLNRDASRRAWREIRTAVPSTFGHKPWSAEDDARLRRGVHHFTQQARVFSRELMTLAEVAGVGASSLEALLDYAGGLASIDADADAIDWTEVCAVHLPRRDPDDAKARWKNCRDPRLEQSAFDEAEDDRLSRVAARFGARDWATIARALNDENRRFEAAKQKSAATSESNESSRVKLRSATQCAGRYQAFLNPSLVRSVWTEEEDAILRAHVAARGAGRWADAARALPGHTHQQALHRWTKVLCPGRRKGPWQAEEDEALRFAVAAHAAVAEAAPEAREAAGSLAATTDNGSFVANKKTLLPWSKIAAHVATRTDVQCRERWMNVLDPARAAGKARAWTAAEDKRLEAAVSRRSITTRVAGDDRAESFETTVAWAQVARDMGDASLTDKLCRNRHIVLRRAAAKTARAAAKAAEKAAAKAAAKDARAAAKVAKAAEKAEAKAAAKAAAQAAKAAAATGRGGKRAGAPDARWPPGKRRRESRRAAYVESSYSSD